MRLAFLGFLFAVLATVLRADAPANTAVAWVKYGKNPILGGQYGTCFDLSVLHDGSYPMSAWGNTKVYRMWISWRAKKSIALVEDPGNGLDFTHEYPRIVLRPAPTGWEDEVNRPVVIRRPDGYHMWYTGQTASRSAIGYATSHDGVTWKRLSTQPVLKAELPWEKVAVMCPDVMWDEEAKLYRMWYSGGEQYEPNAIGYATSRDGLRWIKSASNPIFTGDPKIEWEKERATACHVVKTGGWFYMFYIGFRDVDHAQIGVARSRDGVTEWHRLPDNPIVRSGTGGWDNDACYKPYAILENGKWMLWYNGRRERLEQIGEVSHVGADLGFPPAPR